MTSPESTAGRRLRILRLAAGLFVALTLVGVAAQPSPAATQDPPPVSCITDNPVDPLGPGFLFDRGEFTTIDHPDAVLETAPFGINNRGQLVGGYDTAGFVIHGFLLDGGRFTTIDVPGALRTLALRINARGQILGNYEDERGGCHGFLLDDGRFEAIDVPGSPTQAIGLNDRGQVAGTYIADGVFHGFLFDKGVYTTIDVPGALQTSVLDINARGQILGVYLDAGGTTRAYLRTAKGSLTTFAFPDAVMTVPFGINNRGHVVGYYLDADQVRHGFLFKNGTYTTIDHPLASSDSHAHDVNDRGQIAGFYERGAGQTVEAGDAAEIAPNRVGDIGSALSPFASLWTGVDGFQ